MSSDDLIKNLAHGLKPVKKQSSPNVFAVRYLLVMILIIVTGILSLQLRRDLYEEMRNLNFVVDIGLNVLVLLSGVFLTAWFSSAGRVFNQRYKLIMASFFVIILMFNAYRLSLTTIYLQGFVTNVFDIKCFLVVMILSLLSTLIMTIAVSKRIVFNPGLVGALIGFLSFSVGSFVIGMHCPITAQQHVTLYHTMLPMITGIGVGFLSGKIFLRI